jgi:hypothetical protein
MAKSTWVQIRDWFIDHAHYVIDMLKPSSDAIKKAIPENLAEQVGSIVKDAVIKAELAGGSSHEKLALAESAIIPALEELGVKLAKALLNIIISNAVIALGFSAANHDA